MATVHCGNGCRDGFDGGSRGRDPFAVADSGVSDVVRAESDYLAADAPQAPKPRPRRRAHKRFHRLATVRNQQGVTLRNVARRLGLDIGEVRRQEQEQSDLQIGRAHV